MSAQESAPLRYVVVRLLLLSTLLMSGCASTSGEDPGRRSNLSVSRMHRENTLQAAWSGRSYHALIEAFGSPSIVMTLPSYRTMKTSIVVYGTVDKVTNCIDAFTVIPSEREGELTVADYFCR